MFDKLVSSLLYLTLAAVVITAVLGAVIGKTKKERIPVFYYFVGGGVIGYSLVAGTMLLTLKIEENKAENYFNPALFYPILALFVLFVVLAAGGYFVARFKPDKLKLFAAVSFTVTAVYILSMLFFDPLKQYIYESFSDGVLAGLIVSAVILAALLIVIPLLFGKKTGSDSKAIVYAAVTVALSFALSYLRLFKLPQGGSVTFASLLPLLIYSYKFGIRKGVIAGFIYGVLQAIQDPWIVHPLQFLLDYPLAFAGIGLAGIFRETSLFQGKIPLQFILGAVLAALFRYSAHVFSGILVFGEYGLDFGYSPVAWGFLYNAFVFADMAVALFAGGFLLASKTGRKLITN